MQTYRLLSLWVPLATTLWVAGCERSPAPPPSAAVAGADAPPPRDHLYLDHALTNLQTVRLWVGPKVITTQVCRSMSEVATGLMHRTGIGQDETLFFVFGRGEPRAFYMKNVPFPISAGYIDSDGILQEIVQLKAMDETSIPSKSSNIQFVLEAAPDWYQRNGIGPGALIATERGPLSATLGPTAQVR